MASSESGNSTFQPLLYQNDFSSIAPPSGQLRQAIDDFFNSVVKQASDSAQRRPRWESMSIVEGLDTLLIAVIPCLDDVQKETRVPALELLSLLNSKSTLDLFLTNRQINKLLSVLPSSLIWDDTESALLCAPLLSVLATSLYSKTMNGMPPPLSESVAREWTDALNALLKSARHHVNMVVKMATKASYQERRRMLYERRTKGNVQKVEDGKDEDETDESMTELFKHIHAAAITSSLIPTLARHRLLPQAMEFITLLTRFLPHAAAALKVPRAACACAETLCETISMVWCLSQHSLSKVRSQVFSSCVAAIMEAHRTGCIHVHDNEIDISNAEQEVREALLEVTVRLAIIDQKRILALIQSTKESVGDYESLHPVLDFLFDAESKIVSSSFHAPTDASKKLNAGPVLSRFFEVG